MNPYRSYTDMKNNYLIQVIGHRHQGGHITRGNIQLFEEFNTDAANGNARLFVILIRHRQIEMISDGNKIIENEIISINPCIIAIVQKSIITYIQIWILIIIIIRIV